MLSSPYLVSKVIIIKRKLLSTESKAGVLRDSGGIISSQPISLSFHYNEPTSRYNHAHKLLETRL